MKAYGNVLRWELTKPPTLEELQELVGGWIEQVPYFTTYRGKRCIVLCNEEGKLRRLPPNIRATQAWKKSIKAIMEARGQPFTTIKDVLVGDVVIIMGDNELLDEI